MAWRVGVNDTQQLAAALAFEQMDGAVPFGRTHRGVAGGRCDVEHQVSDVGIAARQDSKLRDSCDGFTDQGRQACDQRQYLRLSRDGPAEDM